MRPLEAGSRLRSIIERDGVPFAFDGQELHGSGGDWRTVWLAFCELALEPADEPFDNYGELTRVGSDSDCDLLLHESYLSFDDPSRFELAMSRQFSFENSEGDYVGMNRLLIPFQCALPEGELPRAQRWGYAGLRRDTVSDETHPEIRNWTGHAPAWARAVEASKSFQVVEHVGPDSWRCGQSDV
jgi:hypothetical protein